MIASPEHNSIRYAHCLRTTQLRPFAIIIKCIVRSFSISIRSSAYVPRVQLIRKINTHFLFNAILSRAPPTCGCMSR